MRSVAHAIRGWTAAVVLFSSCTLAQSGLAPPSFEAASVKPVEHSRIGLSPLHGGPGTNSPGQLSGAASLRALLMRAYELKNYQIEGPAWMDSERYEIAAKIPAGASQAQVALMLRSLLADRFKLVARRETRVLPIYALVVAKNGPKLKESPTTVSHTGAEDGPLVPKLTKDLDGFPDLAPGSDVPRSYEVVIGGPDGLLYRLWARRETMQQLADRLSSQLNRAVVDMTDLDKQYDFTLSWTIENAGGGVPRTEPPPDEIDFHGTPVLSDAGLSIFAALQTRLGLKLEPRRSPLEMLTVERLERIPTPD
jgi:uncharacterized protein (TIGR03435 family)